MKRPDRNREVTRRGFLRGAGLMGVGGAVAALSSRWAGAAKPKADAPPAPPPAYALEKYRKTDPKLVHYELAGSLHAPHPEPQRLAFGPGEILFVTAGKFVTALDRQGETVMEFVMGEEVRCLAIAKDGAIYAGLRDHVEVFDKQGKRSAKWTKWNSPASKAWLASLAVGENDVFVSDAGNRLVWRFDRSGKVLGRIGEKDKARDIPAFVVPSPYFDLEIGLDGLLWVVNPGEHQIEAFTFDGKLEQRWGEPSFGIAGFCGCCNPSYFTRLPDGRFVTSEKGLARVKVYSTKGQFESVVAGPDAFPKYFENINTTPIPMDIAVDAAGRVFVADTLGNEIRIYKRKEQV